MDSPAAISAFALTSSRCTLRWLAEGQSASGLFRLRKDAEDVVVKGRRSGGDPSIYFDEGNWNV